MPQSTLNVSSDMIPAVGLFALFKGESGEGKSTAALSFPTPYVFDFDKKMPAISLKHFPSKEVHWDTFANTFEVEDKIREFENYCPYETLVLDSFTGLSNLIYSTMGQAKGEDATIMMRRLQATKNKNIEMMSIDYYNMADRFCNWVVEHLKILFGQEGNPKHIIVTAHVMTTESSPDLRTKLITRTRSIVGKGKKIEAWLPTEFDNMYVFYHSTPGAFDEKEDSVRRICCTEAFGEDSAKCTFPFPTLIDFTNGSLYDQMYRERTL